MGEQLHAVADAEDGDAGAEDARISQRGSLAVDAGGTAGEDKRFGRSRFDRRPGSQTIDQLAVDAGLAHTPGDQLTVLRSEIEDENELIGDGGGRGLPRGRWGILHRGQLPLYDPIPTC